MYNNFSYNIKTKLEGKNEITLGVLKLLNSTHVGERVRQCLTFVRSNNF